MNKNDRKAVADFKIFLKLLAVVIVIAIGVLILNNLGLPILK